MRLATATALTLGLLLAACARPVVPSPPPPPAPVAAVPAPAGVRQTALGPVLATPEGMTLYTFTHDTSNVTPDVSHCYGRCAQFWPPFRAAPGAAAFGPWSLVRRSDGTLQWAYKGWPLYTYEKDKRPGETSGEGVRGTWHVARP